MIGQPQVDNSSFSCRHAWSRRWVLSPIASLVTFLLRESGEAVNGNS